METIIELYKEINKQLELVVETISNCEKTLSSSNLTESFRKMTENCLEMSMKRHQRLTSIRDKIEDAFDNYYFDKGDKDSIEPYEGCNELTQEQEERQEWLDNAYSSLDSAYDSLSDLDNPTDAIESAQSSLEEID